MLTYEEFSQTQTVEEKKETADATMKDDGFIDVTEKMRGSKRNRT